MHIVKTGIDARPKYFAIEVVDIFKDMGMNTVCENQAVNHDMHLRRVKIGFDQMRECIGDACVCCWVLWMVWSWAERRPLGIGGQFRVSATGGDGCDGAPEVVVVLGVETTDSGISITCPENRHQARAFCYVEFLVFNKISEGTRILLCGVLRPELANLCLGLRTRRTACGAQRAGDDVVAFPLHTVKRRWSLGQELGWAVHREGAHLSQPWHRRGQEFGGSRLPYARSTTRSVGYVRFQAVAGTCGNDSGSSGFA